LTFPSATFIIDHAMSPVCPKCDEPLFLLNLRGTEFDFCAECRGLWLDAGELEAIVAGCGDDATRSLAQFLAREGTRPSGTQYLCPLCDQPMNQTTTHDKLTVERCVHGIWFDADELQQLLALSVPDGVAGKVVALVNDFFTAPRQATNTTRS
jgi:hypothetical protein